jgi:hypothetical protein
VARVYRRAFLACLLVLSGSASAEGLWPAGVSLPAGKPISEEYRREFGVCDDAGTFRGHRSYFTRTCRGDPSRVTALQRLPDGSIAFVSKLAVDLDGSPFACSPRRGATDQCETSLMLPLADDRETPVDADTIPYVVIPEAGPADTQGEFGRRTGIQVGDFGVVISGGRVVPVIVADTGPFSKLGEGSMALHRALGHEVCAHRGQHGECDRLVRSVESIAGDVTTILYPGTARSDLTPATIGAVTKCEGMNLWLGRGRTNRAKKFC